MVRLTVTAAEKLKEMIRNENTEITIPEMSGLRLDITAVNCFGRLSIESKPKEDDLVAKSHGIRLFIDPNNQNRIGEKYPNGVLLYFFINSKCEGFAIENPKVEYSCA
mgnify:CR=1 FL=1